MLNVNLDRMTKCWKQDEVEVKDEHVSDNDSTPKHIYQ